MSLLWMKPVLASGRAFLYPVYKGTYERRTSGPIGPNGARDLSIAAALWALAYADKWREFGTVVVAGTALCVADGVAIWRFGGAARYVLFPHHSLGRAGAA